MLEMVSNLKKLGQRFQVLGFCLAKTIKNRLWFAFLAKVHFTFMMVFLRHFVCE